MSLHYKFQRDKIPFVNFLKNIIKPTSQSYYEDKENVPHTLDRENIQ